MDFLIFQLELNFLTCFSQNAIFDIDSSGSKGRDDMLRVNVSKSRNLVIQMRHRFSLNKQTRMMQHWTQKPTTKF